MSIDRKTLVEVGLTTSLARGRAVARTCTCRVLHGDQVVAECAIGSRPVVVGAGKDCDLILVDPQVSRRHAELQMVDGAVRVKDLGSTNGTWWQGTRITEVVVPLGSVVRFGGTSARFLSAQAPTVAPSARTRFGGLVGQSLAMRELFAVLELAAPTDATVLLGGESGTGKELAARALHDHSARADGPFVVVDCSAIGESLIDSHLFGHVRGAFTGAERDRKGAFVEATGGTLFLDELGELPLAVQGKLLRALEARTVQPLGSDRAVTIDARVVAATHRDLARQVEEKSFRFDLFYRLAVVHAVLPPLRDRLDDLPVLVTHFYEGRGIAPGAIDGPNLAALSAYAWPGNVRELRNVLERAWAMSGGGAPFGQLRIWLDGAAPDDVGEVVDTSLAFKEAKERWLVAFERRYLAGVFADHGGNISRAAAHAGLSRRHMRELLRKHELVAGGDGADGERESDDPP
jgi:DNA-binding NtrC family response regulator